MNNRIRRIVGYTLIVASTLVFPTIGHADDLFYNIPVGTTSSWFTVENWNTSYTGGGASYVPLATNDVYLNGGVCVIGDSSTVFVNKLGSTQYWQGGEVSTLDIELGSALVVSNYCHVGNEFVDATVNVRGRLDVVNANINGFGIAGYRAG